jgi:Ca2+-binding EF-hand superfamily protein
MRKLTLSIAAATLATAGIAFAAPAIMGTNGDMTRAQAQTMAARFFAKMDLNSDGKIDSADRAARQAKMFDRIDTDHNGAISREEFAAMHKRGDRGTGEHAGMAGMNHGQAAGEHRMGQRGRGGMRDHMQMMMRMADSNNDGAITEAEFTAAALKHFDMVDADHNGTVTAAERQAAEGAMKARMQAQTPGN